MEIPTIELLVPIDNSTDGNCRQATAISYTTPLYLGGRQPPTSGYPTHTCCHAQSACASRAVRVDDVERESCHRHPTFVCVSVCVVRVQLLYLRPAIRPLLHSLSLSLSLSSYVTAQWGSREHRSEDYQRTAAAAADARRKMLTVHRRPSSSSSSRLFTPSASSRDYLPFFSVRRRSSEVSRGVRSPRRNGQPRSR